MNCRILIKFHTHTHKTEVYQSSAFVNNECLVNSTVKHHWESENSSTIPLANFWPNFTSYEKCYSRFTKSESLFRNCKNMRPLFYPPPPSVRHLLILSQNQKQRKRPIIKISIILTNLQQELQKTNKKSNGDKRH